MYAITDGSQAASDMEQAYHQAVSTMRRNFFLEADSNQQATSGRAQPNFGYDGSQGSSLRTEQDRGSYAQFPWY